MTEGFHVDVVTCSFCRWKADGHQPDALAAWEAHMKSTHPVYWDQRNTVAATLRAYGVKGHGDCGRLAMAVLTSLSMTPDMTREGAP